MSLQGEVFKKRTKDFGLRVIKLVESLPNSWTTRTLGQQLLRSSTSIGANYRAACRARSRAEFRAKLGICEEEADESLYWMEILIESNKVKASLLKDLMREGKEILAIIISSIKTSRRKTNSKSAIRNSQ
jgi:four helix bundle protein